MKTFLAVIAGLVLSANASACVCFWSETSHVAAGALIAGVATYGADKVWPEHRALIGFTTSTVVGFAGELHARSRGGKFSIADAGFNALGAAAGAFVTDRYLLAPVVTRSDGRVAVGISAGVRF